MRNPTRVLARVALAVTLASAPASGQAPPADTAEAATGLAAIRRQVESLEFEKALAALAEWLARPGLPADARADGIALRAQAHAASGDLDAAESDYKELLPLRPSFAPDPKLTGRKALERFARLAASTVGTLHLDLDPQDARVAIDGIPQTVQKDGALKAIAGERTLHVERNGYDAADVTVHAVAGKDTIVRLRLVPNARTLLVRTDVEGVAVRLDDHPVGTTARPGTSASDPAELRVEDVPLGEHKFRLEKPCFASEIVPALVAVDMEDRAPKALPVITLRPARTRVAITNGTYPGELRVDRERVTALPAASFETCPGAHLIQAIASGRVVWSQSLETFETDLAIDLSPRPNAVLVGGEWPPAWSGTLGAWSALGRLDPPSTGDLGTSAGWAGVKLPPDTDLAIGVIPRGGVAGDDRVMGFSPVLGLVEPLARPPASGHPVWREVSIGAAPVDGRDRRVLLVTVTPGGPAARAGLSEGDAIDAVAGLPVASAADASRLIRAQPAGSAIPLEVVGPDGSKRMVSVIAAVKAVVVPLAPGDSAVVGAAWASVAASAGGDDAPSALANLALLFARAGRDALSVQAWRRAAALDPATFQPRADYAAAAELDAQGKGPEARDLFARARAGATAAGDLALAAAAGDRLADLGVAPK